MADILELTNELAYRTYFMNRGQIRKQLREMNMLEYIALQMIIRTEAVDSRNTERAYLKDLAENLQLTTRQASRLAGALKERGLVTWSHDGDGSEGTYLSVTGSGKELVAKNEWILQTYYSRVIEKYGQENMSRLLMMMKDLETVMHGEYKNMEDELDDRPLA